MRCSHARGLAVSLERYFTAYDEWRNGALDALEWIGVEATRRAETLSVADFVALAKAVG